MKKRVETKTSGAPIIRMRSMAMGMALLVLLIAGPLLIVWKQAYITGSSLRLEAMSDTLSALNKQISALRLQRERLSSTERIEKFARTALHLEYPSSDRIVLLPLEGKAGGFPKTGDGSGLFADAHEYQSQGGRE
jgi:cell division protein FtsL